MKYLLMTIVILAHFDASAQIIFRLSSLSKKDNIEIRNYSNGMLLYSQKFNRIEKIELDFNHSDSLVITKEGFIPLALVNLNYSTIKEINLELPVLSKYEATDTLITYTTKPKFLSNKKKTVKSEYSPTNYQYLNNFPNEILVSINKTQYSGFLIKKPYNEVSNLDGKKFCMSVFDVGIEAIYVVPRIE